MQQPSVFTRILHGEIFQEKIYEDDLCFVILTHEPMTPGHSLVIPKEEIGHLWDASDELYSHLMLVAKQIANKIRAAYPYPRIGMAVEGFGVPDHAHIHVFGLNEGLEPTVIRHAASDKSTDPADLKIAADKLRAS